MLTVFIGGDALKELGWEECETVVVYGWTDKDIDEQRMNALGSTRTTMVGRIAMVTKCMFTHTQWSQEGHKLSTIWAVGMNETSGRRAGIEDSAEQAAQWVGMLAQILKSSTNLGINAIFNIILHAEKSFTQIIREVGYGRGGGKKGSGVLSQAKWFNIVDTLPEDLRRQKIVVQINKQHNLRAEEIKSLSEALAKVDLRKKSLIDLLKEEPLETAKIILSGENSFADQEVGGQVAPEQAILKDSQSNEQSQPKGLKDFQDSDGQGGRRFFGVIKSPEQAAAEARALRHGESSSDLLSAPELTDTEKAIYIMFLAEGFVAEEIGAQLNMTVKQVAQLYDSAQTKIHIYNRNRRIHQESAEMSSEE